VDDREMDAAVEQMRRDLINEGITREPLLTRMACEFAAVLVASRRCEKKPPSAGATRRRAGSSG
jgi:hypothetical protein